MLNAVIERGFTKDKPFLAAWRTAKKVASYPLGQQYIGSMNDFSVVRVYVTIHWPQLDEGR